MPLPHLTLSFSYPNLAFSKPHLEVGWGTQNGTEPKHLCHRQCCFTDQWCRQEAAQPRMAKHCAHSARATAASLQLRAIKNPAFPTAPSTKGNCFPRTFKAEFKLQSYFQSVGVSIPTASIRFILTHPTNSSRLLTERMCGAADHRAEYQGY